MQHSINPKAEYRNGGREVRLKCKCGAATNWHDKKMESRDGTERYS